MSIPEVCAKPLISEATTVPGNEGLARDAAELRREEIFEPYVRLEHGREMHREGSGLGLGIARRIVRDHGGDVTLCNHPDGGLVVTVSLPRQSAQERLHGGIAQLPSFGQFGGLGTGVSRLPFAVAVTTWLDVRRSTAG